MFVYPPMRKWYPFPVLRNGNATPLANREKARLHLLQHFFEVSGSTKFSLFLYLFRTPLLLHSYFLVLLCQIKYSWSLPFPPWQLLTNPKLIAHRFFEMPTIVHSCLPQTSFTGTLHTTQKFLATPLILILYSKSLLTLRCDKTSISIKIWAKSNKLFMKSFSNCRSKKWRCIEFLGKDRHLLNMLHENAVEMVLLKHLPRRKEHFS
jgi:hypothetical protein